MKAVLLEKFGGPENLHLREVPEPKPGPGEVLLRVRACALNHLDLFVRDGIPAYKIQLPHVLGCDVAGEVVGSGLRAAVSPGRSCAECEACLAGRDNDCPKYGIIGAQGGPGGYQEYLVVPERHLLPLPDSMSFEEGAAYPLTFLTVWHMLVTLGRVSAGQTVLLMGAGSGVGVAAIQLAKVAGARVIAASTSEEKLRRAKELGADEVIHHPPQRLPQQIADIVVEHVGPAVFDGALKALKIGGKLVTCGATTGPKVEVDLRYVFSRQLQILGSKMGTQAEMRQVARLVQEGRLKPVIDRCFPLSQAREAHQHLAEKRQFGKVVLSIG